MKHIIAALALLFAFNASAQTVSTDQYRLEKSLDSDPRVLEFTPPGYPWMVCLAMDDGKSGGLACFPKEKPEAITLSCKTTFTGYECKEK